MIDFAKLACGYVTFKIRDCDVGKCADLFIKSGISVKFSKESTFSVFYKDRDRVSSLLNGKIEFTESEVKGGLGLILKFSKRYGLLFGLISVFILGFFLFGRVWDVRIEGSEFGNEEEILNELSESGLYVGASWNSFDKSEVENKMLSISDCVSWVNINRRGSVAYVKVVDKVINAKKEPPKGYANILAERDCVIEEITVKCGFPVVEVGDTVKRGDVLISGIIPGELGGGFCYADGEVKGRYTDSVAVEVASVMDYVEEEEPELFEVRLNFFHFSVNIFKKYRNLTDSCDIIEKNHKFVLSENKTAPISITRVYSRKTVEKSRVLSEKEMIEIAGSRLKDDLAAALLEKDLLSSSSSGHFDSGGYTLRVSFVCRGVVGKTKEFEFSLEK